MFGDRDSWASAASPDKGEITFHTRSEIDSLARSGPRPEELTKVKEQEIRSRETNLRENRWWLSLLVGARREGEDPASRFALPPQLARLTPEVIRTAAGTYLDRKRYVRVTLLPDGKTE